MNGTNRRPAPAWQTTEWFNTPAPLTLEDLRGRVVVLHAFQMLCPGCVSRALPQAKRVAERFRGAPLTVVGLHTVFEHHDAQTPTSLEAFLHEYRLDFPVAVDRPGPEGDPLPATMRAYGMRGTPTTVTIDAEGLLVQQVFGAHEDLELGAQLGALLSAGRFAPEARDAGRDTDPLETPGDCDDEGCPLPGSADR